MQIELWRAYAVHDRGDEWAGRWTAYKEQAENQAKRWKGADDDGRISVVELQKLRGKVTTERVISQWT